VVVIARALVVLRADSASVSAEQSLLQSVSFSDRSVVDSFIYHPQIL